MSAPRPARPVLVPRPAGRGANLLALLADRGVAAQHHPLIRLAAVDRGTDEAGPGASASGAEDPAAEALRTARVSLAAGEYTHLVVTSRTAAEALGPVAVPAGTVVVAVGPGTAAALEAVGITTTHVAAGSGAALVQEMPRAGAGASVLFPASAAASRTVPEGLRAEGCRVHEVTAYRPQPITPPVEVTEALAGGGFGAIVLTSPMIARRAAELGVHASTAVVTIGDPSSAAARAAGLHVDLQADEPTDVALADAVKKVLGDPSAADPTALP